MKRMHSYAERGADRYETPPSAVRALFDVAVIPGPVWEPACATGNISKVLEAKGLLVYSSDLYPPSYGTCPVDFLNPSWEPPEPVNSVVTNPPYRLANEFVRRALEVAPHVFMLLKTTYLEGMGRSDIIEDLGLVRVYQFRNRIPMMHRDGWTGPRTSNPTAYAWFEWRRGFTGNPVIQRITAHDRMESHTDRHAVAAR